MIKYTGGNHSLRVAKVNKNDEFYTQLVDIENELKHYKDHFKGKTVFCNCDLEWSNFVKYFQNNFEELGLKKLLFSGYNKESNVGDFRSPECIELLKEADIVVTNPPFSLFREYVSQLVAYNKKFLIMGNLNAITMVGIFALIKEGKLWLGSGFKHTARKFRVPNDAVFYGTSKNDFNADKDGNKYITLRSTKWFTNLDYNKKHEDLILYKKYTPEEYPHYDNYDAINVDKTKDIPADWSGAMGVPITFLDKFNPNQFEIIKFKLGDDNRELKIGGRVPYCRILIRNKKV